MVVLKNTSSVLGHYRYLSSLTTDASGKLNVLRHDCHTLRVDSAQVRVLEEPDQVGLSSFLESENSRALETEIGLEVLGNLTDKSLERQLADEKLGRLLVFTDLTESDRSGAVSMGLLHATCTK